MNLSQLEQNRQRAAQSSDKDKCCSDNCALYRGKQNTGVYGSKCLNWYDLPADDPYHPDKHPNSGLVSNYCRNPSGWRNAWCYIRLKGSNLKPDWENCALPNCTANDLETCCDRNCTSYRGTLSTSKSGKKCLPWADVPAGHRWHPNQHPNDGLVSNYCRNPTNWTGAWCVVQIVPKPKWESCDMPYCLGRDPGECCSDNCASYRGEQSISYDGKKCLPWKDLPADNKYHPDKHPNKGLVSNYCRNPSGWRTAWCYVKGTDGKVKYASCALPNCTASASEKCCDGNCASYRGKLSTGVYGSKCRTWKDLPGGANHKYHPTSRPDAGLESNYCRNPSGYGDAWCYTADSWEPCALPQCSTSSFFGMFWYIYNGETWYNDKRCNLEFIRRSGMITDVPRRNLQNF